MFKHLKSMNQTNMGAQILKSNQFYYIQNFQLDRIKSLNSPDMLVESGSIAIYSLLFSGGIQLYSVCVVVSVAGYLL